MAVALSLAATTMVIGLIALWTASRTSGPSQAELATIPSTPTDQIVEHPGFVGSDTCVHCHQEIVEKFSSSGMSQALSPWTAHSSPLPEGKAKGIEGELFSYRNVASNGPPTIVESLTNPRPEIEHELSRTADIVIGAGIHSQAFAYRAGEYFYQLPVEWYPGEQAWDMAPGFDMVEHYRFFRPISGGCIGCHGAYPIHRPWSTAAVIDPVPKGIDCERCHGPAQDHLDIVFGRKKPPPAGDKEWNLGILSLSKLPSHRQNDVCAQCHLQGEARILREGMNDYSYRPGMPLQDFCVVLLPEDPPEDSIRFVSHVERMFLSECYQKSGRSLTCATCHDPHESPRKYPRSHWNRQCLSCHETQACQETPMERAKFEDDCVGCHMPQRTPFDMKHTKITDHWIRSHPAPEKEVATTTRYAAQPDQSDLRLAEFTKWTGEQLAPDVRALSLAQGYLQANKAEEAKLALDGSKSPSATAHMIQARIHSMENRTDAAIRSYREALRLDPRLLQAHRELTLLLRDANQWSQLEKAAMDWLAVDPLSFQAYEVLGGAWLVQRQYDRAKEAFDQAVRLGPGSFWTEVGLAAIAMESRDLDTAERHFLNAVRLKPDDQAAYNSLMAVRKMR